MSGGTTWLPRGATLGLSRFDGTAINLHFVIFTFLKLGPYYLILKKM